MYDAHFVRKWHISKKRLLLNTAPFVIKITTDGQDDLICFALSSSELIQVNKTFIVSPQEKRCFRFPLFFCQNKCGVEVEEVQIIGNYRIGASHYWM
ncbi:hypothetical protein VEJY3_08800 [Vibrio sp. EJY3]|nr:hypothetical protein VEJY3_08800 [Vibrio sp. EJY3]